MTISRVLSLQMLDTDSPYSQGDSVRLVLLQLACLFIDYALPHMHDANQGGGKLKKIMTFSWPALLNINCVDPATKYHGHLVFCHIISKVCLSGVAFRRIIQQGSVQLFIYLKRGNLSKSILSSDF